MKKITHLQSCPSCNSELHVQVLGCRECGLKLEGHFEKNPLHALTPEELHFVQLFLHCEGSIRGMEKALGVSYPTVKSRLTQIKNRLGSVPIEKNPELSVIEKLEQGELSFEQALSALKGEDHA